MIALPIRGLSIGLVVGVIGLALVATPAGFALEEDTGLGLLFALRGPRQAPPEVVIVAIDKASADALGHPPRPDQWPRSLHAQLVDDLSRAGAAVVAFDLLFHKPRDVADDMALARAISRAGNVALVEKLERIEHSLPGTADRPSARGSIEKRIAPIPVIEQAQPALAPFPLPRTPVRVNAYWPFRDAAGDSATLPVVAFQLFALRKYDGLLGTLADTAPIAAPARESRGGPASSARAVRELVERLRAAMTEDPVSAARIRAALDAEVGRRRDLALGRIVATLLDLYAIEGMRHLDFYGPPRSITTLSYSEAAKLAHSDEGSARFRGMAVFVGLSEPLQPEQTDDHYYTVFSQSSGVDLNGVEIAATAFANLLEDRSVRWLPPAAALGLVCLWGVSVSVLARSIPTPKATALAGGLAFAYAALALQRFTQAGVWLPLVTPLLVQTPLALAWGALLQYREVHRERDNIRRAFGYYLPSAVVDKLAKDISAIPNQCSVLFGICLATDIEGYTSLSEKLEPAQLRLLLNKYFDAIFRPVRDYDGMISDAVGDAMLAIWAASKPDLALRTAACRAALKVEAAAQAFSRVPGQPALPTRIGLESGQMALGNVGGATHYEYRAVGDIVNTANRIQSLNKLLGTRVLASGAVLEGVMGLLTREVGVFRLTGKSIPVTVHELICTEESASEDQSSRCAAFAASMSAWRARDWEAARQGFERILEVQPEDGPARFYLKLCQRYANDPPVASWDAVLQVEVK